MMPSLNGDLLCAEDEGFDTVVSMLFKWIMRQLGESNLAYFNHAALLDAREFSTYDMPFSKLEEPHRRLDLGLRHGDTQPPPHVTVSQSIGELLWLPTNFRHRMPRPAECEQVFPGLGIVIRSLQPYYHIGELARLVYTFELIWDGPDGNYRIHMMDKPLKLDPGDMDHADKATTWDVIRDQAKRYGITAASQINVPRVYVH